MIAEQAVGMRPEGTPAEVGAEESTVILSKENKKFHRVFGPDVAAALESTLEVGGDELNFDPNLFEDGSPSRDLIFRNGNCWRVYHPARFTGDITQDIEARVTFMPWFSGPEVIYNRLVLRCRPITGRIFRWIAFARLGEEKPFSFSPAKAFINLDFFSKRADNFAPLFVKIRTDLGGFNYFLLEGKWSEAEVTLNIRRVAESEVPPHLAAAKP